MNVPLTLGQQLDAINARLDATTVAWALAGHPDRGPLAAAREAAFYGLHRLNHRIARDLPTLGGDPAERCVECERYEARIEAMA